MATSGYSFTGKTKTVLTTSNGKQVRNEVETPVKVTSAVVNYVDENGNVLGSSKEKRFVNKNTKVTTTQLTSSTSRNIDGAVKVSYTGNNDWYDTQDSDNYVKKKNGVVLNTSSNEYQAARNAKKTQLLAQKKTEENENVINVLKNEIPLDIEELRTKVNILFELNNIASVESDETQWEKEQLKNNRDWKVKLKTILQTLYNLNQYKRGDVSSTTSEDKHVAYIESKFKEVFDSNKSDKAFAQGVVQYIINDLISVNDLVKPSNEDPPNLPNTSDEEYVDVDIFTEWAESIKEYLLDVFVASGRQTPETQSIQITGYINNTINDALTSFTDELRGMLNTLSQNFTDLQNFTYNSFLYNFFLDLEQQILNYNITEDKLNELAHNLPLYIVNNGNNSIFTNNSTNFSYNNVDYTGIAPIFGKRSGGSISTTDYLVSTFFEQTIDPTNYSAIITDKNDITTQYTLNPNFDKYSCVANVYQEIINLILRHNTDFDSAYTYTSYNPEGITGQTELTNLRVSWLRNFTQYIRSSTGMSI